MPSEARSDISKGLLLAITSLASSIASLFTTAISIALPSIGNEFSLEAIILGWITTSFVLATAVTMIPIGRIADIYGRKKVVPERPMAFYYCISILK